MKIQLKFYIFTYFGFYLFIYCLINCFIIYLYFIAANFRFVQKPFPEMASIPSDFNFLENAGVEKTPLKPTLRMGPPIDASWPSTAWN